jgi:molecular chaperone GrpE (heat shock protein)
VSKQAKTKAAPEADEFASAMQQLSAEAEKKLPPSMIVADDAPDVAALLTEHFEKIERTLTEKIDNFIANAAPQGDVDLAARFKRMDEQLTAIRSTESVNQRLFDSLHEELLKYRDNFLHESLQKPFIHDLVHLFDDLLKLAGQLRSAAEAERGRGSASQWRDNLENAIHSLVEILERFEVKEIEPKENVDRSLHKVVSFEPADFPEEDGRIVMRVKRGFVWRGKLIRPEEVIAKRFN